MMFKEKIDFRLYFRDMKAEDISLLLKQVDRYLSCYMIPWWGSSSRPIFPHFDIFAAFVRYRPHAFHRSLRKYLIFQRDGFKRVANTTIYYWKPYGKFSVKAAFKFIQGNFDSKVIFVGRELFKWSYENIKLCGWCWFHTDILLGKNLANG